MASDYLASKFTLCTAGYFLLFLFLFLFHFGLSFINTFLNCNINQNQGGTFSYLTWLSSMPLSWLLHRGLCDT